MQNDPEQLHDDHGSTQTMPMHATQRMESPVQAAAAEPYENVIHSSYDETADYYKGSCEEDKVPIDNQWFD